MVMVAVVSFVAIPRDDDDFGGCVFVYTYIDELTMCLYKPKRYA